MKLKNKEDQCVDTSFLLRIGRILAQKLRIPKIQFAKYKKIKKEDQLVDTSFLLRIGNKIPMEGVTETKFGAKTKEWTTRDYPTQRSIP